MAVGREGVECDRSSGGSGVGDVGVGKAGVELGAAFKVAGSGRQVLMLVPTKILAEQDAATCRDRFRPNADTADLVPNSDDVGALANHRSRDCCILN